MKVFIHIRRAVIGQSEAHYIVDNQHGQVKCGAAVR